ncbi:flagellar export protein FliJ [Natribacillus halophilus]|uniref:Flagellar FliJ protein n=1 Tax=Natribacillus halophilus TaxID=549003 RepID=A0A1G8PMT1_9BACI|nr:flagellar export protein FliJ [Natribacillus halophilus]SDI93889.1 flagellar FliJ protein [Natribacillus halophilus]
MTFTFTLEKLLEFKEREAVELRKGYEEAIGKFETIGYELYRWLKARETLDESQHEDCQTGTTIAAIQSRQMVRENVETTIARCQVKTNAARKEMAKRKEEWQAATIECKKYEKMKGRKWEEYQHEMKKQEQKFIDEIASRQVLRSRSR